MSLLVLLEIELSVSRWWEIEIVSGFALPSFILVAVPDVMLQICPTIEVEVVQ